ncbi:NUDIX domain-containing protein [Mongoliitalea daihaiensis]|uniref:NUDIX domain-containing protein n=1 Tax=Mongoliitalea daihaiensis TaxID=2782006 RepID=UPI001F43491D|nr:NUDIX hydrolase [Mongoliitalea daihaiensis]UJP64814.1 NUDIX hydrolase [Mongoliitalea daihaiensis]
MKNPWTTLSKKLIYENQWISVSEHQVINPSSKPGIYGKVSFLNKALGIIPVDEEFNTWLVGQYRYTLDEYSWEIPMGGGLLTENVLENAKRELKEETGITANRWTEIMRIHTSNSVTDEEGFVFLAQELSMGIPEFEETEQLEIKKLPLKKALQQVMDGEITDAISIAGLLKVAKLLDI